MRFSDRSVSYLAEEDGKRRRLAASLDAFFLLEQTEQDPVSRAPFIPRRRKPVKEIFAELGPSLTRRAYRMTEASFWELLHRLKPFIKCSSETNKLDSGKTHRNGAKNGLITAETRLSVALRFYAGGRPEDIMLVHGISFVEVYKSVWVVADAVNSSPLLRFQYSSDHDQEF